MADNQFKNTFTDRRSLPRFSPNPATTCEIRGVDETATQSATVNNISSNGIKITVSSPIAAGTSLILTLLNKTGPFVERTVVVRVMRASQQADGNYVLGCAFQSQLTGHELLALAL
jgi:hypothetical protein